MNSIEFSEEVRRQLRADGYEVRQGSEARSEEHAGKHGFTLTRPGWANAEHDPAQGSEWEAWAAALAHRLAEGTIPPPPAGALPLPAMGPFFAAHLPDSAFDADARAARFGITHEAAREQVEQLHSQTVYVNERYQVNVQMIPAPFGPDAGDMVWLSIKRCDLEAIHDWRELQAIKNQIVGDEHEGFEVYPAESRLVDSTNQFHLWVFADPKVRLPVGFRAREVMDARAAASVGARQRPFAGRREAQPPAADACGGSAETGEHEWPSSS
ncbi:hypothetical protein [Acidovorax sp. SDU_ACID1]|uniref:DUF7694 domain-containing protein n=1 Tax=Acidovorax sp. SDU_ACID1 TaxID=3136632 RepID=UPI0038731731